METTGMSDYGEKNCRLMSPDAIACIQSHCPIVTRSACFLTFCNFSSSPSFHRSKHREASRRRTGVSNRKNRWTGGGAGVGVMSRAALLFASQRATADFHAAERWSKGNDSEVLTWYWSPHRHPPPLTRRWSVTLPRNGHRLGLGSGNVDRYPNRILL